MKSVSVRRPALQTISRRHALRHLSVWAAGAGLLPTLYDRAPAATASTAGPFTLPPLPYSYDALEPYIDAQTMQIHHDRHHAGYVTNLNKAIIGHPSLEKRTIQDLLINLDTVPEPERTAIRQHGGGHHNHSLFWPLLKKNGGQPRGELAQAINKKFSSFDAFKDKFIEATGALFGSGWVWLSADTQKNLLIEATSNQDSVLTKKRTPLLGLDLWEHAYYLKYQNRRPEYVLAFFHIINWDFVSHRYTQLA